MEDIKFTIFQCHLTSNKSHFTDIKPKYVFQNNFFRKKTRLSCIKKIYLRITDFHGDDEWRLK